MNEDRFDSQDFHELMMDYRAAVEWGPTTPSQAFSAVVEFIRRSGETGSANPTAARLQDARDLLETLREYPDFDDPSNIFAIAIDEWLAEKRPRILGQIEAISNGVAYTEGSEHQFQVGPYGYQCGRCGVIWHELNGVNASGQCASKEPNP